MGYHEVGFETEPPDAVKWLHRVQPELFELWYADTKHKPGKSGGTLACRIRSCNGPNHQSLPCAMLQEANEIGLFLEARAFNDEPVAFFRLFAFLLDELTERMRSTAKNVIRKPFPEQPKSISVWGNIWAKHRLKILLQHHPCIMFLDRCGLDIADCRRKLAAEGVRDRCGNELPLRIIDEASLGEIAGPNWETDNRDALTIVIVPPLRLLLVDCIAYFKSFVELCRANSDALDVLESDRFACGCF